MRSKTPPRIAPGLLDHYLASNGDDGPQTAEPEDPNRRDNLFEPVPGDHGAHSSFDERAWSTSPSRHARHHRGCFGYRRAASSGGTAVSYRRSALPMRTHIAALTLSAFLAVVPAKAAITETRGSYSSGGRRILVEQYQPGAPGKRPALILLHGSAGVLFPGLDLRQRARHFAAQGYAVFLPHFFNRTGHFMVRPSGVHENLPVWTSTVQDCVTYVSANRNVDAKRIGLLGHSLGGYLALSTAARDRRIKVVVEASGALDNHEIKRLPPTLILHGAKDETVPIEKARQLEAILKRLGTPYQKHIYPEEPHLFSRPAMQDIWLRIDAFLRLYFPTKNNNE